MSAKRSNQKVTQQKYPMLYLIPLIAVLAVIPALLYECCLLYTSDAADEL